MRFKFLVLFGGALLCHMALHSQTFSSKLLDKETNQPIPYAAIVYGEEQGVISNEEGDFSFTIDRDTKVLDSIYISCMGYESKSFTQKDLSNNPIFLIPGGFQLTGVNLLGKGLTAREIVEKMVDSIPVNYNKMPVQKNSFYGNLLLMKLNALK